MRSESSIQRSVIDFAKSRGCLCKKLSVQGPMGNTGWPDYMLISPRDGKVIFMEFKRLGGTLTALQQKLRDLIEACGLDYYVVDNPDDGKMIITDDLGL